MHPHGELLLGLPRAERTQDPNSHHSPIRIYRGAYPATDPSFGNPYNDIGCYLMQKGELDEAVSWFERAKKAARYEPRHFPYLNLGRLHAARGDLAAAVAEFHGALEENPEDPMALKFLETLKYRVN